MSSRSVIVLGIAFTFGIIFMVAISFGYSLSTYLLQDGSTPLTGEWDIDGNYILEFPLETWIPLTFSEGVTDKYVGSLPSGIVDQDRRFLALLVSVDSPPGVGKTVSVTISDGTDSLEVTITGDTDLSGYDDSTPFNLDVSAETLSVTYSQTAGGSSECGCVLIQWYYKVNE